MKRILLFLLLLPLASVYGQTPSDPDIQQGRRIWRGIPGNQNDCRLCHGDNGEGGFATSLAGHTLTDEQFLRVTREGAGRSMPGFTPEKNLTDQEVFQVARYLRSLPRYTGPQPVWRTAVPPYATARHRLYIETGCGQCHGLTAHNPRRDMGALGSEADFEWFETEVYSHTTSPDFVNSRHLRMGNYRRDQISEETLREIWTFVSEDLGPRVPVNGSVSQGVFTDDGIQYTINLRVGGNPGGDGMVAEHLTLTLPLLRGRDPEEITTTVAATSGAEYVGVQRDWFTNTTSAIFYVPRMGPGDQREITITLAGNGAAVGIPRAWLRWELPKLPSGASDMIMLAQPFSP